VSAILRWLADHFIGPACPLCRERQRGPRTLDAHVWTNHAGDADV
jgi:hypothetical protein